MSIRKIITIAQNLTGIDNFDVNINRVNFVPDEVIVRTVTLNSSVLLSFLLYSNLIEDVLFVAGASVGGVTTTAPNISYIPRGGNGVWNFSIRNINNEAVVPAGNAVLYFQLEFIKH